MLVDAGQIVGIFVHAAAAAAGRRRGGQLPDVDPVQFATLAERFDEHVEALFPFGVTSLERGDLSLALSLPLLLLRERRRVTTSGAIFAVRSTSFGTSAKPMVEPGSTGCRPDRSETARNDLLERLFTLD
uniref:(northern house mosquito) hypothetical protein n=1 Tax=Culex pipiens TaxID=7175 RepID=A0A8D8CLB6_CULPI